MKTKQYPIPENTKVQITEEGDRVIIEFVPEKVGFEPKDGDFICNGSWILLVSKYISSGRVESHAECLISDNETSNFSHKSYYSPGFSHFATPEQKQILLSGLKKQGLRWNPEEKRIEKIRWRAENGHPYYFVQSTARTCMGNECGNYSDNKRYICGNYFETSEQSAKFADIQRKALIEFNKD